MPLGTKVCVSPGDSVLDGDPGALPTKVWSPSLIFGPFLLWPNGWMHQDATWYGRKPEPMGLCVRWGPRPSSQKGGRARGQSHSIFGPCLLWPKGWMDQGGTWDGDMPWSSPHCAKWWRSSPPQKGGHNRPFSAHIYCGQTA